MTAATSALDVADWRRRVHHLYDGIRRVAHADPASAHRAWVEGRDRLFREHPATPLLPDDREAFAGLPVADYDPAWRFELDVDEPGEKAGGEPGAGPTRLEVPTGTDGVVPFELIGTLTLPGPGDGARLGVWRLASYGGGLFVPVRDALAGADRGTYGGGRYLLDTVKGADLGSSDGRVVVDLNFAYNPSCAYDPEWACPLAPPANVVDVEIPVGERMPAGH